jgi:hypothetical protein
MAEIDVKYVKQLSVVLKKKDVDALRDFLREEASARDPLTAAEIDEISDCDLEIRMYKMILARPDMADIHSDARRWMNDHGFDIRFG